MADLRFGVSFHPYPVGMPDPDLVVVFAQAAEELGFDSLWVGDHILWRTPLLEPLTLLAGVAMSTKRIKLGTGVLLLPLRQPTVLAKMVATLDYLSRGRVILGVGVGGENPKEFEACGVPLAERGRRTDEGIAVLRRLWTESSASYAGQFWRFSEVDLQPKPVQQPGPPIWVGGRSDAALRRAGRLGDGWIDYFVTPQGYRESMAKVAAHAAEAGRSMDSFAAAHVLMTYVAPSKDKAKLATERYLSNYYDHAFRFLLARYCALGTAEDCIAKIKSFEAAGARDIVLVPTCGPDSILAQLETLASEVVAAFR